MMSSSKSRKPRLPYMGHVILIAEEVSKMLACCPPDLEAVISPSIPRPEWDAFVDTALRQARERDTQSLAGGKPVIAVKPVEVGASKSEDGSSDSDEEEGISAKMKFGEPLTRTAAQDTLASRGWEESEGEASVSGDS